jgi:hypothetical protein
LALAARAQPDWPGGETLDWIVPLAEPYLRGYIPRLERGPSLHGYRFLAPGAESAPPSRLPGRSTRDSRVVSAGFFLGFLTDSAGLAFLNPQPPECLVFCFVRPLSGALHRRLVENQDSLMRRTAEYIRWLTHRPPRFEFFAGEPAALVRHTPMRDWPRDKYEHLARNFFIETLAWLVRSALARRLAAELALGQAPSALRARSIRRSVLGPSGLRK